MTSFVEDALHELELYVASLQDEFLKACCGHVLDDPRFQRGYGSSVDISHKHHAYVGGLVVHTGEVVQYAVVMGEQLGADLDILITAAIWHDFAKIYDYDDAGPTRYKDSFAAFCALIQRVVGYKKASHLKLEDIGHCILAHHGRKEWGSPVEPQTREAASLHYADMLSMQFGAGR